MLILKKYFFSTFRINCSSATRRWRTANTWNHSGAWTRQPQEQKLQNKSNKDKMHNHQDKEMCEGHPNISRRLPQEGKVKSQLVDDKLSELLDCFAKL